MVHKFFRGLCVAALLTLNAWAADVTVTLGSTVAPLKPLLSVNAGPTPPNNTGGPDYTAVYQRLGVKMVRTHDFFGPLDMPTLYPDFTQDPLQQSSYNFTTPAVSPGSPSGNPTISSDEAYRAIVNGGFGVYLRIGDSAGHIKTPSDSERANWAQAAVQVLKHYTRGQWGGFNHEVAYVEIGNEPDSSGFWTGSPLQFYQLYVETAQALRAEFPTLKIGGPGITQGGFSLPLGQQWLNNFLDHVKTNGAPLDFLSWHLYSNDPAQFATAAAYYRQALDAKGFTSAETHVTEWNAEGSNTSAATNAEYRAKARGAAVNTATWIHLQEQGVDQAFFYHSSDVAPIDGKLYGLFALDGSPKRVALAFSLWNETLGYGNRLPVTLSGEAASSLKAMGLQRSDGAMAVLVANTGSASVRWTAALPDARSLSPYALTLKTLDDSDPLLKISTPLSTEFDLAAGTVQMLLVHAGTNAFTANVTAYGKLSRNYLALDMQAAAADVGQSRKVYFAATLGGQWFLHNGTVWLPWTSGALPVYANTTLPAVLHLPVFNGGNASFAAGVSLFVGYGLSDAEMLSAGRYKAVFTVPAQ